MLHITVAAVLVNSIYDWTPMVLVLAGGCLLGGTSRSTTRARCRVLGFFFDDVHLAEVTVKAILASTAA